MNRKRILLNASIAFEAVLNNLFRSILTALGIIFGVSAVIAMLAIGKGAQQEILDQIKLVGANNIEILPLEKDKDSPPSEDEKIKEKRFTPGLNLKDALAIVNTVPRTALISPEIMFKNYAQRSYIREQVNITGVENWFFDAYNFGIRKGNRFHSSHLTNGDAVCIIGRSVETKFFGGEDAIGQLIKCGNQWLRVIGITDKLGVSEQAQSNLGIRDYNNDIYVPIKTFLLRFGAKGHGSSSTVMSGVRMSESDDEEESSPHQLSRLTIQMQEAEMLPKASELIREILKRRHNGVDDFEVKVPEMLLKQQQRTKDIFNIVLGCIAGISLVVGGIGIMNIMLASVYERIKEIGIRMSLGATQKDIIAQFLMEAITISLFGGIIGVLLGIGLSLGISGVTDIKTIISIPSVILSFGVSAGVGLIFGLMPARKAAKQDPITSLRHE